MPACAPYVVTGDGERLRAGSAEFREYAERVFRMHNEVTTSMAYAIDEFEDTDGTDEYHEQLIDADDRMMQACSALDELALARRDGRKVSMKKLLETAERIPGCETASREAASLIK